MNKSRLDGSLPPYEQLGIAFFHLEECFGFKSLHVHARWYGCIFRVMENNWNDDKQYGISDAIRITIVWYRIKVSIDKLVDVIECVEVYVFYNFNGGIY